MKNKTKKILYGLSWLPATAVIILLWWIISAIINVEFLLPSPSAVAGAFVQLVSDAKFYAAVGGTCLRTLLAFLVAFVFAALCGIVAAKSKIVEKLLQPAITLVRAMPTVSIVFLAIIWMTAAQGPVLITFLVLFPTLYSAFLDSLNGIDKKVLDMSDLYGVSKMKRLKYLYVPAIAPTICTQAKNSLSMGIKLTVAGEALSYTASSLGFLLQKASASLETAQLLAYSVVAVFLGFLMECVVALIWFIVVRIYYAKVD